MLSMDKPEGSRQPELHDGTFTSSLQMLRQQLDAMNLRTAGTLFRNQQDETPHYQQAAMPISMPLPAPSAGLQPPNGPAFWQLYRSLRTDLRSLEARVENLEDSFERMTDRLDTLEPIRLTPPESPAADPNVRFPCTNPPPPVTAPIGNSFGTAQPVYSARFPIETHVTVVDVGYFDPSPPGPNCYHDGHVTTDDVVTFISKLRRVARTKRIIDIESFLKGSALRLYRMGYNLDGTNIYELENGTLDLDAFEAVLVAMYQPLSSPLQDQTYTDDNLRAGDSLVDDYALPILSQARCSRDHATSEKMRGTYEMIMRGIKVDLPSNFDKHQSPSKSLPEFLTLLRNLDSELRPRKRARADAGSAPSLYSYMSATESTRDTVTTGQPNAGGYGGLAATAQLIHQRRPDAEELSSTPVQWGRRNYLPPPEPENTSTTGTDGNMTDADEIGDSIPSSTRPFAFLHSQPKSVGKGPSPPIPMPLQSRVQPYMPIYGDSWFDHDSDSKAYTTAPSPRGPLTRARQASPRDPLTRARPAWRPMPSGLPAFGYPWDDKERLPKSQAYVESEDGDASSW